MKLSQVLKDWPEKQSCHCTECKRVDSCDREIDREALAKILMNIWYSGCQKWENLEEDKIRQFEFEASEIISTMPTWLKRIEK